MSWTPRPSSLTKNSWCDVSNYGGCSTCEGRCCYEYVVPVSGHDVAVLAAATGLRPEQFIVLVRDSELSGESPEQARTGVMPSGGDGVRLVADGPLLSLVLDKKQRSAERAPCIFLLELRPGLARCGVYAHRPMVCAAFPFAFHHGSIAPRDDALCGADAWALAALDLPALRGRVLRAELEWAVHRVVAAHWNERVDKADDSGQPRLFSPTELFDYLLDAYARIAQVRAAYSPSSFERLVLTWGRPDPAGSTPEWASFLAAVADVLA